MTYLNNFICKWLLKLTFAGYWRSLRHGDLISADLECVGVK